MKGLAPYTRQIFEAVSKLECIQPYLLVGGTALSLQINTRQSEDLDFMKWRTFKAEKMEVMLRRSNFRDYYDIYSILKSGIPVNDLISLALSYSGHKLKSKNLLAMLTNSSRFTKDANFKQLEPVYTVTPQEIEEYIKSCLV